MEGGELTTGQKLLASLHSSQTVRQERYASTVQAKMAEARDRLNTQGLVPKHAVKADLAIFGDASTEVHRLMPEAANEQVRCMHYTMHALLRQHVSCPHLSAIAHLQSSVL